MKVLRQAEQARMLGVSRWTVRRIAATDPAYPRDREISPGVRGVLSDEFEAWLRSRPAVDRTAARETGAEVEHAVG